MKEGAPFALLKPVPVLCGSEVDVDCRVFASPIIRFGMGMAISQNRHSLVCRFSSYTFAAGTNTQAVASKITKYYNNYCEVPNIDFGITIKQPDPHSLLKLITLLLCRR